MHFVTRIVKVTIILIFLIRNVLIKKVSIYLNVTTALPNVWRQFDSTSLIRCDMKVGHKFMKYDIDNKFIKIKNTLMAIFSSYQGLSGGLLWSVLSQKITTSDSFVSDMSDLLYNVTKYHILKSSTSHVLHKQTKIILLKFYSKIWSQVRHETCWMVFKQLKMHRDLTANIPVSAVPPKDGTNNSNDQIKMTIFQKPDGLFQAVGTLILNCSWSNKLQNYRYQLQCSCHTRCSDNTCSSIEVCP